MTRNEEIKLLKLVHENNILLQLILLFVYKDEANDFITNITANLLANKIDSVPYVLR